MSATDTNSQESSDPQETLEAFNLEAIASDLVWPPSPTPSDSNLSSSLEEFGDKTETSTMEYKLNGVTFKVNKTAAPVQQAVPVHSKATRQDLDATNRLKLLDHIQAKQQILYQTINVSINDPEKMTNTYNLSTLLIENKKNLLCYDLLAPFSIVTPENNAFVIGSPTYGQLKLGPDKKPLQQDLFTDYLKLTVDQVAQSSKWYSSFVPSEQRLQEDLSWSLLYYEKNVESELYLKVYSKLIRHEASSRGGPLYLKLLLDSVTTTGEQNLKSLLTIVETYRIKTSCPGEDIDKVISMFDAIFDNINTLRDGILPPDVVENLLIVLQSTSVPKFNTYFERFQNELIDTEIQVSIDPSYQFRHPGSFAMGNNIKTVKHILSYAEKHYRNLLRKGEWDACLQKVPGKSAFLGDHGSLKLKQPTKFNSGTTAPGDKNGETDGYEGGCFNCGEDHLLRDCPYERDPERIARNRAKHPMYIKLKERNHRWRKPEPGENGKRIVNGKPHTYDPSIGRNGRWVPDETPTHGQPNDGTPPQVLLTEVQSLLSRITGAIGTATESESLSDETKEERRLAIHMSIQKLKDELSAI